MFLIILLLFTSASCKVLPDYDSSVLQNVNNGRFKRDVNIEKNADDKFDINFSKKLLDHDKKLSVYGEIEGVDKKGYDSMKAGVDFADARGDRLGITGIQSKESRKLTGEGELNVFKTDTQSLNAKGFGEKDFFNAGHYQYGGILDYHNNKGHDIFVKALQDSAFGKEFSAKGKYTIVDKPNYNLNAYGFWDKDMPLGGSSKETYGAGLGYLNKKGDVASLLAQHTPDLGNELSASGKFNLLHNDNHNLDITGKFSRVFPSDPKIGPHSSYSANMGYLYKDKFGADLGVKHSGLLDQTDISALGKLNIFKKDNTHLDVFGGVHRSFSPKFDTGFNPNFGVQFETNF